MSGSFDTLLRTTTLAIPVVAGLVLVIALGAKERWPALGAGLAGALVFALIGFGMFGRDLASESGWGWVAVGAAIMIGLQACAGFVFGVGVAAAASPRYRRVAVLPLLFGLLAPFAVPLHQRSLREARTRRWTETQERIRREPHAVIDDITLPEEADSGYRIRFVDDTGAVRAHSDAIAVTPYVFLPPGRHKLVLQADTPKAARLKLEWALQAVVEVEAGHRYRLQVAGSHVTLQEVTRFKEPDPPPSPSR